MIEIANRSRRRAVLRRALVTVPAVLLLGIASGELASRGYGDAWFDHLAKPGLMPAAWVFPAVWSSLYIMMGFALAIILDAREAKGRGVAIFLFMVQLGLNLAWSPAFFLFHRIMLAFGLLLACLVWAGVTALIFWKLRRPAGLLMIPELFWLTFVGVLNWQVHQLNPYGLALVPMIGDTQIIIQ